MDVGDTRIMCQRSAYATQPNMIDRNHWSRNRSCSKGHKPLRNVFLYNPQVSSPHSSTDRMGTTGSLTQTLTGRHVQCVPDVASIPGSIHDTQRRFVVLIPCRICQGHVNVSDSLALLNPCSARFVIQADNNFTSFLATAWVGSGNYMPRSEVWRILVGFPGHTVLDKQSPLIKMEIS